jgi:hypothetical protein
MMFYLLIPAFGPPPPPLIYCKVRSNKDLGLY